MFSRSSHARRRRARRLRTVAIPAVGAALLVTLLPSPSLALPPDPSVAEKGRETLVLESLGQERTITGDTFERDLESLKAKVPADLEQAPAGTATAPAPDTGTVTFGSTATAARAVASVRQAGLTPVDNLPVSLGQAPDQAAPTGTWNVQLYARGASVSQGVDGAVVRVQAPATGSVPVSVELDYTRFKNLYGADWASRLRFVQFPECYLTTPEVEACQEYEELETRNDTRTQSITATVDTAADGTVSQASATEGAASHGPSTVQAAYRMSRSTSATPAAVSGDSAVIGAVDSGGGAGGTFKATPLASNGKWQAGGSSGAFMWSYPLAIPAAPAGPVPGISFTYNSQSVDGRTAIASPQSSWIGEGWEYDPGHIERRYRTCKDDRKPLKSGTPNNTAKKDKTSDLCWTSYNAVMSLAGKTTELVRDAAAGSDPETDTEIYRPQQDDGTRVEHRTGGTNGDNNGEYWVVTTVDGTAYYYGLNQVGGGHADTRSVSTVPVFGNHPGEPCHATAFADSRCGADKKQAWRWGLDKVVDVHGNVMVVNWKQETNHYSVKKKFKSPEQYDRFAYPTSIEYGMRSDLTKPSATVEFGVKQRCLKSDAACDPANFAKTDDPGAYRPWWDTPGNLNCKSGSKLCPPFPSFWTQMRLDTVTTKGARPGQTGLGKVDTYELHQSFPEDWYDTSPGLWLNSITRRGFAPGDTTGTLQHKDGVSFAEYSVGPTSPLRSRLLDRQLANLVPTGKNDQRPAFTRPRIGTVATEYGGDIEVEYKGGCASEPAEDKGKNNGTCFPVRWSPDDDERTPAKSWFNKYVVHSVTETDKVTSHGKPIHTTYAYTGPAWAKSVDEFTRPALQTHSDWRGFREVAVTKGSKSSSQQGDPQSQSYSVTRYFQGVGGTVKDSTGAYTLVDDDAPQYAGLTAESIAYLNSDKRVQKRTLHHPWSKETASRAREAETGADLEPLLAHRAAIRRTDEIETADTSWRSVRTLTSFEGTYGLPHQIETAVVKPGGTGGETLSSQSCTRTSYLHNTSAWLIGLTQEQRTTATSCASHDTADPAKLLKSAVRYTYDKQAYGVAPTRGEITTRAETDGAGTSYARVTEMTYDTLGRKRTVTEPGKGTAETQYTPHGGRPGHLDQGDQRQGPRQRHDLRPGTQPGAHRHRPQRPHDEDRVRRPRAFGQGLVGVPLVRRQVRGRPDRLPERHRHLRDDAPCRSHRQDAQGGRYLQQARHGLRRPDAQGPDPGGRPRPRPDCHGHLVRRPRTGRRADRRIPGKGRPRSRTVHPEVDPGDSELDQEPLRRAGAAGPPVGLLRRRLPVRDLHLLQRHQHLCGPCGRNSTTDPDLHRRPGQGHLGVALQSHGLLRRGTLDRVRVRRPGQPHQGHRPRFYNSWSYTYDARGRVTSATDPDTGTTETWYDAADRPNKMTDSKGRTTYTEYDVLGRVTKVREGSQTATPVKEYTYDTLPGGLGKPVASARNTATGSYVNRVTGYDTEYRPTGRETVIPSNAMTKGVSGTYAYAFTYTPVSGKPQSVTLPAVGGLAAEKVITRYNSDDLAESTSGGAWYTSDVTYSPFGEPLRTVSGSQPTRVWTTNFMDPHTGRLQRTVADRETAGPHRIADNYYAYDASGTITADARSLSGASGTTWDTQCFTYDAMGELVNAWTSSIAPNGKGTGCKASNGAAWGPRTDYEASTGPVADAPDAATDTSAPDASLTSTLAAAEPDAASIATGATAYGQSFTFDWLGNRASLKEHDPADATKSVTYSYGYDTKQPHAVDWISSSPSGRGSSYIHDVAGNTEVRDLFDTTQGLTWTQENRLDTITADGSSTSYVYDAEGNRLLEKSEAGSTLYLGETEVTTNASGTVTKAARAYAQQGAPTVIRTTVNGATTGHKINVLLADHLGTSNTAVELSGTQPVTRRAYKPYGELRGVKPGSWPSRRGYLGVGIDDAATGLTHIGAREYDQAAGRFLSADPLIDIADPLQMNGYAYSNNSPISKSDPSGLMLILIPGMVLGGGGGGGTPPAPKLTDTKTPDGRRAIYDEYGIGHVVSRLTRQRCVDTGPRHAERRPQGGGTLHRRLQQGDR